MKWPKGARRALILGTVMASACGGYESIVYYTEATSVRVSGVGGAKNVALAVGDSLQLHVVALRDDGTDGTLSTKIQWLSRSAAVVVSSAGLVRGASVGGGYVIATIRSGTIRDSVFVTVATK